MKCIVEVDLHVTTCPGTFLRDYEYVYIHMEMLGLEARTKSVPPTFPLFYHERLRFERTFYDCTDPGLVASLLKGEDIIIELRQHTDYVTDGKVIAHCSSNTHDFLYPAIPPYYGSGREILLYKTSKFKPIRVTGEPVKLEFSTKTIIKEVPDYDVSPRRSVSPSRSLARRSASPARSKALVNGTATVEALPAGRYSSLVSSIPRHYDPYYTATVDSLRYALDDLELQEAKRRAKRRHRSATSPHLVKALNSSKRIQARIDDAVYRGKLFDSDLESDIGLDILRESLREERNTLNDAIKEADREAFYRSLNKTR
jgi:hypothetical protein